MSTYDLLTTTEAAERINLSEIRVRQLCREGRLGKLVGRQYLISPEELQQFAKIPRPVGNPNFKRQKK